MTEKPLLTIGLLGDMSPITMVLFDTTELHCEGATRICVQRVNLDEV